MYLSVVVRGEGRGGGEKFLLLRTFAVQHSSTRQPSVRSGKRIVAKGKIKNIGGRFEAWQITEYERSKN